MLETAGWVAIVLVGAYALMAVLAAIGVIVVGVLAYRHYKKGDW